jgi:hypothetical protein
VWSYGLSIDNPSGPRIGLQFTAAKEGNSFSHTCVWHRFDLGSISGSCNSAYCTFYIWSISYCNKSHFNVRVTKMSDWYPMPNPQTSSHYEGGTQLSSPDFDGDSLSALSSYQVTLDASAVAASFGGYLATRVEYVGVSENLNVGNNTLATHNEWTEISGGSWSGQKPSLYVDYSSAFKPEPEMLKGFKSFSRMKGL